MIKTIKMLKDVPELELFQGKEYQIDYIRDFDEKSIFGYKGIILYFPSLSCETSLFNDEFEYVN